MFFDYNKNKGGDYMISRPEYPRPQFVRKDWINLNGEWDFTIDNSLSGEYKKFSEATSFDMKINVPFCPESKLSDIEHKDFMNGVWYTRTVTLPNEWLKNNRRTFINIGACDYITKVFVNGKEVGVHRGGYVGFSFEITEFLIEGENRLTIFARDDSRLSHIPSGKQSPRFNSYGCFYTRTTGIWQTVWLENTPCAYLKKVKMTPNIADKSLHIIANTVGAENLNLTATAYFDGKEMGSKTVKIPWNSVNFTLSLNELYLWDMENPNLYDITFTLGEDKVESYFGMREIVFKDYKTYLNGKSIFQRLILDQGFYPDGIYTAPSEEELVNDIKRSMDMGYNGARLHEKVFEPLFLYHCDRLGYIVWGEYPNWGLDTSKDSAYKSCINEWLEELERDYNHPSIIGWCPFNETTKNTDPELSLLLYNLTKAYDPTRLFIDNSGWYHIKGTYDMFDVHDYEGRPQIFNEKYLPLTEGKPAKYLSDNDQGFKIIKESDEICFVSEFGGIGLNLCNDRNTSWGYGASPESKEAFIERYKGCVDALLDNSHICAFCYTQLTDVEQEQNGLYTYDRVPKIDPEIIKEITSRKAAVEE